MERTGVTRARSGRVSDSVSGALSVPDCVPVTGLTARQGRGRSRGRGGGRWVPRSMTARGDPFKELGDGSRSISSWALVGNFMQRVFPSSGASDGHPRASHSLLSTESGRSPNSCLENASSFLPAHLQGSGWAPQSQACIPVPPSHWDGAVVWLG